MKKSLSQAIALAALMGGATAAHAVSVNPDGIGGALVYPLYTVNEGNTSLVSVVNTSSTEYKAVKVRFVEAKNSAEVLDFHLYLSPNDVWSGTIVPTATGAKLVSNDRSCIAGVSANDGTFPKDGLAFSTDQITMDEVRLAADKRSTEAEKIARVRVGHFEAIEMGVITGGTPSGQDPLKTLSLQQAILHTNGVPGSCNVVTNWWKNDLGMNAAGQTDRHNLLVSPDPLKAATGTVGTPTGRLYGTGGIVNVAAGWAASYDAVALINAPAPGANGALTNFYTTAQHPRPGSIYPHLGSVTAPTSAAQISTGGGSQAVAAGTDFVVPSDTRLNEVTTALNVAAIYNDYYVEPALDAGSELVVTFPTKRFYTFETTDADATGLRYIYTDGNYDFTVGGVNGAYAVNKPAGAPATIEWASKVAGTTGALAAGSPFETIWDNVAKTARVAFTSPTLYGKDEQSEVATDGFISPRPIVAGLIDLNYEANVIALNGSNALGTSGLVGVDVKTPFMEGWLKLSRPGAAPLAAVPAVGFGLITTKNGVSADGALRNFAQTFKHKTVR